MKRWSSLLDLPCSSPNYCGLLKATPSLFRLRVRQTTPNASPRLYNHISKTAVYSAVMDENRAALQRGATNTHPSVSPQMPGPPAFPLAHKVILSSPERFPPPRPPDKHYDALRTSGVICPRSHLLAKRPMSRLLQHSRSRIRGGSRLPNLGATMAGNVLRKVTRQH